MTKKDFLQKGSFKQIHLQLTISFFPENVTFFNEMNCGHKYDVDFFSKHANETHSLRKKLMQIVHNKGQ